MKKKANTILTFIPKERLGVDFDFDNDKIIISGFKQGESLRVMFYCDVDKDNVLVGSEIEVKILSESSNSARTESISLGRIYLEITDDEGFDIEITDNKSGISTVLNIIFTQNSVD